MSEMLMLEKREIFKSTLEPMFDCLYVLMEEIHNDIYDEIDDEYSDFDKTFKYIKPSFIPSTASDIENRVEEMKHVSDYTFNNYLKDVDFIFSDEKNLHDMLMFLRYDYFRNIAKNIYMLSDTVDYLIKINTPIDEHVHLDKVMLSHLNNARYYLDNFIRILSSFNLVLSLIEESHELNKSEVYRWQN